MYPTSRALLAGDDELKGRGVGGQWCVVLPVGQDCDTVGEGGIELGDAEHDAITVGPGNDHRGRQRTAAKRLALRDARAREELTKRCRS